MGTMRVGCFRGAVKDITFRRTVMACFAIAVVAVATFAMLRSEGTGVALESSEPNGPVKTVLVQFGEADFISSKAEIAAARTEIDEASSKLESTFGELPGYHKLLNKMKNFPMAVYEVDAEGEAALKSSPLVKSVAENELLETYPQVEVSSPIEAAMNGSFEDGFTDGKRAYDGTGQKIVVIDSGVNKNHGALAGRVVQEACFSYVGTIANLTTTNACPGGTAQTGAAASIYKDVKVNAALPCDDTYAGCDHGTMVAASAVMEPMVLTPSGGSLPSDLELETRGVASGAGVIAVKAGSYVTIDGEKTFTPDSASLLFALDYVYDLAVTDKKIAAVNISAGSQLFANTIAECKNAAGAAAYDQYNGVFGQLKDAGVATFAASGNWGDGKNQNKVVVYSCMENVVAVSAAKNDGSGVAAYANNGALTDLLAPGGDLTRILADGDFTASNVGDALWMPMASNNTQYTYTQGTSFASPMAAGSFAVLREKHPTASVDSLVGLLKKTGKAVTDSRAGYTVGAKPLIQLNAALAATLEAPGNGGGTTPTNPPTNPSNPGGGNTAPTVPNTSGNTAGAPRTGAMMTNDNLGAADSNKDGNAIVLGVLIGIGSAVGMTVIAGKRFLKR